MPALGIGDVPLAAVPTKLPWTSAPVAWLVIAMPPSLLAEMTLRWPALGPPMRVPSVPGPTTCTPCVPLPSGSAPPAVSPRKFAETTLAGDWKMLTPAPVLPEITLRSTLVVPPTTLPDGPPAIWMPVKPFGMAVAPLGVVPMKLAETRFSSAPSSSMSTPWNRLPEITLRRALVAPPIVLWLAPKRTNTPDWLGIAAVPARFSPMSLPATTLSVVPVEEIWMPDEALPEMRLRAVARSPPTVFAVAPLLITTPVALGRAAAPVAVVPRKLPATTLPDAPSR